MISIALRKPAPQNHETGRMHRFAIIIPAHDEELLIGQLLESIGHIAYPDSLYDTIVIADNCTDRTESIALNSGALCYRRTDPVKRGKPYALEWIFNQFDLTQYDAYVLVDADTTIDTEFLRIMNHALGQGHNIIQGYFGILNPDETWLTRLMVIPGVLKYHFRYHGKARLGFSCPLMGNGMCFTQQVIQQYGWDAFTLTENWEYFIRSMLRGLVTTYAEAHIYSQTAATMGQGRTQRQRWFKGKMQCVQTYLPKLFIEALRRRDWKFIDCIIELVMPSISMLLNFLFIALLLSFIAYLVWPPLLPFFCWALGLMVLFISYFIFGILANRSSLATWAALAKAPFFLLWKMTTTVHAILTLKKKEWIKTKRH